MANTKKRDEFKPLESYLFSDLGLCREDEGLEAILGLLEKSGIDSTGLLAVKTLMEVVLAKKLDKLKADIRQVLDQPPATRRTLARD